MSSNYRGRDEHGIVHYCYGTLFPWCSHPFERKGKGPLERTEKRREVVTCLLCWGIRLRQ